MSKKKVVIFSGAGISAESGVQTFRSNGGLWDEYKVEEVATPEGWAADRSKVLEFYNKRRAQLKEVHPNDAHKIAAQMEEDFDVTVITQNVDDLHQRAGSTKIHYLHGELVKVRSTLDPTLVYERRDDVSVGDKCERGSQLRPHIVWFGEPLDGNVVYEALQATKEADVFIIVGTSLIVEPAASTFMMTKDDCLLYYVDPAELTRHIPYTKKAFFYHYKENATTGVRRVYEEIKQLFKP
jgi:NAD-dependent deacetylase